MLVQTVVAWNKLFKVDLIKKYRFPEGRIHEDEFFKIAYNYSVSRDKSLSLS